ncbi:sulfatase [Phenylobacterium sp.]|uniref:sulfatase family protein n=1 Tax=Phenylobacterium sp. TaxID=1871053 RepID=UPI00374CE4FC
MAGKVGRREVVGGLAAAAASGPAWSASPGAARPNILLLLADDWSWQPEDIRDRLELALPTFGRVRREGAFFSHAFAASPSCTASRGALLTGQWPWRLAEGANLASILPRRFPVYPEVLEAAGYHVGYARKGWAPGQLAPGRRTRNPAGPVYDDFEAFLAKRPAGAPFCFWFGTNDPHRPYVKGAGIAAGIDPAAVTVPPYLPDTPAVRGDIVDYRFEVERFDRESGEILARLSREGLLDNTLVAMTGDNGWPFPRGKATLYDAGWHVPLAVMWKAGGVRAGAVSSAMVSLTDLAPTFLAAAGASPMPDMTGVNLLPHLRRRAAFPRDHVIGAMERHMDGHTRPGDGYPMRALRTERYLYIRNFHPERWPAGDPTERTVSRGDLEGKLFSGYADIDAGPAKADLIERRAQFPSQFAGATGKRPAHELYDVAQDPYVMHDLARDPAQAKLVAALDARLTAELRATRDPRVIDGGGAFDDYPSYNDPGFERPPKL